MSQVEMIVWFTVDQTKVTLGIKRKSTSDGTNVYKSHQ